MYHWVLAFKNMTTNEKLRGAYKKSPNPYDLGAYANFVTFWSDYPGTPSNIFDGQNDLLQDEELFYLNILRRYGKLVYLHGEADTDVKEYRPRGDVSMFNLDDRISIDDKESIA